MIRIGIAGIGFMGMIHYLAYKRVKGTRVVALAEQDEKRLAGDWRTIKGNFGPPGEMMDLSGIATYREFEDLVADDTIDLVDLCLPPDLHAKAAIAALKAGKHVFCEKPIALRAADAKRMVAAAKASDKMLMIGHVLPFFPEYQYALNIVRGGKHGRLLGGHFKRIISNPTWLKNYFDPKRIGGPMMDLHVHDAHFIRVLCGMPRRLYTTGRMRGAVAEFFTTQFLYGPSGPNVTATSGIIGQQGRPFTHGFEIHLERATLLMDFSVIDDKPEASMPLTVLTADGKVERPKLEAGDAIAPFATEIGEVAKSIRSGRESSLLGGQLARDALVLCDKQTESLKKRRQVKVIG